MGNISKQIILSIGMVTCSNFFFLPPNGQTDLVFTLSNKSVTKWFHTGFCCRLTNRAGDRASA